MLLILFIVALSAFSMVHQNVNKSGVSVFTKIAEVMR